MKDKWMEDGGPAYPITTPAGAVYKGTTLRDYFAVHASEEDISVQFSRHLLCSRQQARYLHADEMLKARGHK